MQQASGDKRRAIDMGGGGAMTGIITGAIGRQRSDVRQGAAADLGSYVNLGIQDQLAEASLEIEAFGRKVEDAKRNTSLIGASGAEVLAASVEQEAAAAKLQKFGTTSTPAIEAWAAAYKIALTDVKKALEDTQQAQEAFNAELAAAMAANALTVGLDPISQANAQMEAQLAETGKRMGVDDPEFLRIAAATRQKAADERLLQERMSTRELEKQLRIGEVQFGFHRMSRDEFRVQNALLQKRVELEMAGKDASGEYYQTQMRLTEALERQRIEKEKNYDPGTKLLNSFEDQLDKVEGLFSNTWKDIFTNGLESGAEIFGKGMTDIILDISAQMINEIAIRPFAEMAKNMAMAFANSAVEYMFGPSTASAKAAAKGSRDGNAFSFAKGSPFSNKVFDHRTMFSFANGTKLGEMAEAGPEAVMPLERGADGKLGVLARGRGGDGGGVQISIHDHRSGGAPAVEVQETKGPDGMRMIDVMIRDAQKKNTRNGSIDREMASSYGAQRVLTRK